MKKRRKKSAVHLRKMPKMYSSVLLGKNSYQTEQTAGGDSEAAQVIMYFPALTLG